MMIYRMSISQNAIYDFSSFNNICGQAGNKDCLNYPYIIYFTNTILKKTESCHESCTNGCSRWGSCNQCKNITCSYCENFNETCNYNNSFNPCVTGYRLSEDKSFCCTEKCSLCYGPWAYLCSKCAPGYKLTGSYCHSSCPPGYSQNSTSCKKIIKKN